MSVVSSPRTSDWPMNKGRGSGRKNELLYGPQLWPEWLWYAWRTSIQGLEYHFERPTTTFTHTALTCQGHDFKSVYRHRRRNHVVSRGTPLHTAAEAPHAAHSPAQPLRSRHGSRHQRPMPVEAKPQTSNPKLDQMAPRATRPRRQHVEVAAQRHDDESPWQRGREGARQPSARRRRGPGHSAARSARPAISNCHVPAKGARAHDQARVKSVRDE